MKKKKANWGNVIIYIILIMGIVITLLPFAWMLLTSLKGQTEAVRIPPSILPKKPLWGNYKKVFEVIPFGKMYFNTIVSSVVTVGDTAIYLLYGRICLWKDKIPRTKYNLHSTAGGSDDSGIFFHSSSVPYDSETGVAEYTSGTVHS